MTQPASKRRVYSFDMAAVTPQGYALAEAMHAVSVYGVISRSQATPRRQPGA